MKSEFFAGHLFCYPFMVEATGFEPAASASRKVVLIFFKALRALFNTFGSKSLTL